MARIIEKGEIISKGSYKPSYERVWISSL